MIGLAVLGPSPICEYVFRAVPPSMKVVAAPNYRIKYKIDRLGTGPRFDRRRLSRPPKDWTLQFFCFLKFVSFF